MMYVQCGKRNWKHISSSECLGIETRPSPYYNSSSVFPSGFPTSIQSFGTSTYKGPKTWTPAPRLGCWTRLSLFLKTVTRETEAPEETEADPRPATWKKKPGEQRDQRTAPLPSEMHTSSSSLLLTQSELEPNTTTSDGIPHGRFPFSSEGRPDHKSSEHAEEPKL